MGIAVLKQREGVTGKAVMNCDFHHIYCKWKDAQESKNTDAYLVKFYSSLSSDNRIALIDWVMHNFNDEIKIIHD